MIFNDYSLLLPLKIHIKSKIFPCKNFVLFFSQFCTKYCPCHLFASAQPKFALFIFRPHFSQPKFGAKSGQKRDTLNLITSYLNNRG